MGDCVEVPLTEMMRSIPKDYRTIEAYQWDADGTEVGHRFIPVGHMMHEAANEIDRLRGALERLTREVAALDKKVEAT